MLFGGSAEAVDGAGIQKAGISVTLTRMVGLPR
jgi:hypothetical protein